MYHVIDNRTTNYYNYEYGCYNCAVHKLTFLNIILHVDKCVLFTFAPQIIPLIYVSGHLASISLISARMYMEYQNCTYYK